MVNIATMVNIVVVVYNGKMVNISTINGSDIHYNYQHLVTMQFIISYNLLILLVLSLILTLILPITNNSLIIEMLQHIFCNSKC